MKLLNLMFSNDVNAALRLQLLGGEIEKTSYIVSNDGLQCAPDQ